MKIKALMLLLVCCYFSTNSFAQYDPDSVTSDFSNVKCNDNLTFLKVETMPKLIGGYEKLVKKINQDLKFTRGKKTKYLTCKIAINCEGKIYDSRITMNSLDREEANEILDYIIQYCEFSPGQHKLESVDCFYYFYFFIENGKVKTYKS